MQAAVRPPDAPVRPFSGGMGVSPIFNAKAVSIGPHAGARIRALGYLTPSPLSLRGEGAFSLW